MIAQLLAALRQIWEKSAEFWNGLSRGRKIVLVLAAVSVFSGVWKFRDYMARRALRPLYTDLAPEEAGVTVSRLKQLEIPYRLAAGGTTIMVPESYLDEARLKLATEKLPRGGRLGFELFDESRFGATEFTEQVNFRRALEGELERTIASIEQVKHARVHISLPKRSVFLDYEQPAKASVVLELERAVELTREQVDSISHLISSAVEGLDPSQVVVVDTGGHILARPKQDQGDYSTGQLDFQRQIEAELRRKILATLEPYVGFDRSRASVAAECDWNGGEQTEEIYDPNTVIMTKQRSEELSRPLQESGLPGTASNLPRQPATPRQGAAEHSRTMETTNFKTSRTVTSMRLERGNIKRLSVAVLVDQVVSWDDAAQKLVRTPRTVDEMESLRKLVVAAAGIDEKRGDVLIIDNLPFTIFEQPAGPPEEPETDPGVFWMDWLRKNRYNFLAAFVVLVIGLVVAMVWGRGHKKRKVLKAKRDAEAHSERMQQELEDAEEVRQLKEAEEAKLLEGLRSTTMGTSKSQILKKHLEETATKDPAGFVDLLRSWIHEDDE